LYNAVRAKGTRRGGWPRSQREEYVRMRSIASIITSRPAAGWMLAASLLVVAAAAPTPVAARSSAATKYAPVFSGILSALRPVQIPIELPVAFPSDITKQHMRLYASVADVSAWSYIIDVDFTKNCHGADVCNYAEIDGGPTIDEPNILDYPWGVPVKLAHNVRGLYQHFLCGASCGQSAVVFKAPSTGIIYMAAIHAGNQADTVALANAMLVS
jgi:hypothetical protein